MNFSLSLYNFHIEKKRKIEIKIKNDFFDLRFNSWVIETKEGKGREKNTTTTNIYTILKYTIVYYILFYTLKYYTHECYFIVSHECSVSVPFDQISINGKKYTSWLCSTLDTHNMCVPIQSRPNTHCPFVCIVMYLCSIAHFPDVCLYLCVCTSILHTPCRAH